MSIRISALYIVVLGLSIFAWKDWFKSLCAMVLMMALFHHEDMPSSVFGIQGLNPWNILCVSVFLAWLTHRRREGLKWDMPRHIIVLLLMYFGVILVGVLRAVFDRSHIEDYPLGSLISEELVNTIKWVVPGLLMFDGCRTRKQLLLALAAILGLYALFALQVVRRVPWAAAIAVDAQAQLARMRQCRDIGYAATDLSVMLAGACWGTLAALALGRSRCYKGIVLAIASMVAFGQALTGGRAGYVAWGATGLVLCILRWRKYLILAPVVVLLLPIVVPGAVNRMFTGIGLTDAAGQTTNDPYLVTSGRADIWPYVIDKIGESPLIGHGRLAMKRTGLQDVDESFPHPHNMYLETLLDNGILGSIPIFVFFATMTLYSARLFTSSNRLYSAVGGLSLALILSSLLAGVGGQHFYPQEHTLGIWVAMLLSLRVYVEEKQATMGTVSWQNSPALQQSAMAPVGH
jgi:O-antigen ligase